MFAYDLHWEDLISGTLIKSVINVNQLPQRLMDPRKICVELLKAVIKLHKMSTTKYNSMSQLSSKRIPLISTNSILP